MIRPERLFESPPRTFVVAGLRARTGLYALCDGALSPAVYVDRRIEGQPGFEALIYHESLHAVERHALIGLVLLTIPVVGWVGWIFWRRAQEVRADAFAFAACARLSPAPTEEARIAAAKRELVALTLMHAHPTRAFWRWCYGRNPKDRLERALRRARRIRWPAR